MLEKLGLGTVQFGQPYGISNRTGQVAAEEAARILTLAADNDIRLLDTAANYGEAEAVLGRRDTRPFRIVTKTIGIHHGIEAIVTRARQSAAALKADTLLVHAASDLAGPDGNALWRALLGLRDDGTFRKIGLSVYVAEDPASLAARYRPDVMQLPFSLLDQRLLDNGTLSALKGLGVEIHARSLFLQGLLFLDEMPEKLKRAAPHMEMIRATLREATISPLAAALGFVLTRPEIGIGLVGVTSADELREIIAAARMPLPDLDWKSFALDDETVLTPSLW